MILPNYGPDDLERDMEAEAARIEAKADILEKKAEIIDEKLDKLESIHETLKQDIPELKNLDWF
jgi:chaperonin cofactor prefoldin